MPEIKTNTRQSDEDTNATNDREPSNVLTTVLTTDTDTETSASKDGAYQGQRDTGGYVPSS